MSVRVEETITPYLTTYFFVIYDRHTKCFHGGGEVFLNARKNTQKAKQYKSVDTARKIIKKLNMTGVHDFTIVQYVTKPVGLVEEVTNDDI